MMNWDEALKAMKRGAYVRRKSQMYERDITDQMPEGFDDDDRVVEQGEEGCHLAAAWTVDNKPVMVFMGASSRYPFIPEDCHTYATDWIEVTKSQA
jgi:hypothetical protein